MRVELLVNGIHPGSLLSTRDITLRKFLAKQKSKESTELMVSMAASTNNIDIMKKRYRDYIDSTWYTDVSGDRDAEMAEYYHNHVKHLQPELYADKAGGLAVRGLD